MAGERFLAELVPPLIKLALVAVGPLLGYVVRRVARARGVVDKERPIGRLGFLVVDPVDCAVGHVCREIIVLPFGNSQNGVVLGHNRVVLSACSAEETPEVIEAEAARPAVERTCRALLVVGCEMPFAERRGRVAAALKDLRDTGRALGQFESYPGHPPENSAIEPKPTAWWFLPDMQRGPCWRAERRHVEPVITQALAGQPGQGRRLARAPKCRGVAEARVIDQHENHVRRIRRGFDRLRVVRLRARERATGNTLEWLIRPRYRASALSRVSRARGVDLCLSFGWIGADCCQPGEKTHHRDESSFRNRTNRRHGRPHKRRHSEAT